MKSYVLFIAIWGSFSSALAIPMDSNQGKVEFLAIGKPAAIKIKGEGKGPTGQFDLKRSGNDLKLTADLNVDLETLDTGISLRDRHMKEKYLETGKYKTAILKVADARLPAAALAGTGSYTVSGTLMMKGVEKPVDIALQLENLGESVKAISKFKINLADYTIDVPKYAGITVANDVEVSVETLTAKSALPETK